MDDNGIPKPAKKIVHELRNFKTKRDVGGDRSSPTVDFQPIFFLPSFHVRNRPKWENGSQNQFFFGNRELFDLKKHNEQNI